MRYFVPKKRSNREQTFQKFTFVPKYRQNREQTHGTGNNPAGGLPGSNQVSQNKQVAWSSSYWSNRLNPNNADSKNSYCLDLSVEMMNNARVRGLPIRAVHDK